MVDARDESTLSCDLNDYVEIACLFAIPVTLVGREKTKALHGILLDTGQNADLGEFVVMACASGDAPRKVALSSIACMRAQDRNPHFTEVRFEFVPRD